uniref:Cytochrome c oxidase subunit n=1 Tax=Culicoides sonorensis TaxID=179676 RepID=A0A336KAF3_CULSO
MATNFARRFSTSMIRRAVVDQGGPDAGHSAGSSGMWKKLSFLVAFPAIGLCMANVYLDHKNHPHAPPEFIKYDYLRIRTKRFPWGDGNHSLFHNPHMNPLPDGYEEEH